MKIGLACLLGLSVVWLLLVQREEVPQEESRLPKGLLRMGIWLYRRKERLQQFWDKGFETAGKENAQYRKYQAGHIDGWSAAEYEARQAEQLALAWIVLPLSCLLALAAAMQRQSFLTDGADGQMLLRPDQWNRSEAYEFYVDGLGDAQKLEVTIDGTMLQRPEELLQEKADSLTDRILGENESLEQVYRNLNLVEELDGVIEVTWRSEQPELINSLGIVENRELEQPELAQLWATLTYGEARLIREIPVRIMPAVRDAQYYREWLLAELQRRNEEFREEKEILLPKTAGETALEYHTEPDRTPLYLLLLGVVLAVCLSLRYGQQIESDYRKRNRMLQKEYGSIVSQLAILLQCGLPVRNCWQRMIQAYEREKTSKRGEISFAYEEMLLTHRQIMSGMQESRAYLEFGNRCEIYQYRRLGMLLEQTVRQGSSGLAQLLENEAFQAMEERKNLARKRAAEAETKMMIPMFLMLGIVIVIVMVPALMTM